MARFIQETYPSEHAGLVRVTRGLEAVANLDRGIARAVVSALAFIGKPVSARFAAWNEARRQARDDRKMWELALTDARVMADLSRAMSSEVRRPVALY